MALSQATLQKPQKNLIKTTKNPRKTQKKTHKKPLKKLSKKLIIEKNLQKT
jgi:hypothetical protein